MSIKEGLSYLLVGSLALFGGLAIANYYSQKITELNLSRVNHLKKELHLLNKDKLLFEEPSSTKAQENLTKLRRLYNEYDLLINDPEIISKMKKKEFYSLGESAGMVLPASFAHFFYYGFRELRNKRREKTLVDVEA
ncbi:hypothetical protein CMI39_01730 [Candidatus Pacearchaeota archaeon]|nr:hypothetical protein [Candidatus Pacearchaeota archaeon]|tara:strand:+ start:1699 stop:2109 length:411 start_codon:yes stop_codon:yes gene_type:complete